MLRNAFSVVKHCKKSNNPILFYFSFRCYSSGELVKADEHFKVELEDANKRQRKTEWKRRQRGQTFLDNLIVTIRGGKGGDGCVAFHREKFVPYGPPSGGNGGRGGDVYILPTPGLTTLSSIPKRIRGSPGGNGKGTWMNGKNGEPIIIRVPVGTVARELPRDDSRRAQDEWEAEEEGLRNLSLEDRIAKKREKRWVHYPGAADDNIGRDSFQEAEQILYRQERERRVLRRDQQTEPLFLDLAVPLTSSSDKDSSDPVFEARRKEGLGYLVARGGEGGLGNPAFLTAENRSPKWATRGTEGDRITLSLELKILADIGLVGYPNAGKSTLLRALTGGRAKTEVAGYAFTTLNPSVAVVRIDALGNILGAEEKDLVIDETRIEEQRFRERMERGELADVTARIRSDDADEDFRFTVADNPGLISHASENVGLGHSFLRSIERSLALVYVVDFSGPDPQRELRVLRDELEAYQPGLSTKARLVVANKADLLGEGDSAVEEARDKLGKLRRFVDREMIVTLEGGTERRLDVVPISAKFSQNLQKVVLLLRKFVEESKQ